MDYEGKDPVTPVPAAQAHLFSPSGVCVDPSDATAVLLGGDDHQRCVRRLHTQAMTVDIVAGQPDNMEPHPDEDPAMHAAWLKVLS